MRHIYSEKLIDGEKRNEQHFSEFYILKTAIHMCTSNKNTLYTHHLPLVSIKNKYFASLKFFI